MQIVTSLLVFLVSSYLSAVDTLAHWVSQPFVDEPAVVTEETVAPNDTATTSAPTSQAEPVKGGTIPQILIENADYQKAAVVESIAPADATSTALEALVNVYCEHQNGNQIRVTTGTGFFIDTDGIILTNAHVAHFLLMDELIGETTCTIRTGDPAEPTYTADLLYISPSWVRDNAAVFNSQQPLGTGERDYALLYVTGGIDDAPMPGSFPALPFDTELLRRSAVEDRVYVAGYPATTQFAENGRAPLVPRLSTTTIAELRTFGSNYADVFSIRGTSVGERGASGGPVLTTDGEVIGLISTKGDSAAFGTGALRAITLSYIDRTIEEETGFSLRQNLAGDLPYRASIFNQTMVPFLRSTLEQAL